MLSRFRYGVSSKPHWSIVEGVVERSGFEEVFDRVYPAATRLARRMVGEDEAEDVAVEALARAMARWGRVGSLDWVDAWIMRATSNVALDVLRSRRRRARQTVVEAFNVDDEEVALRLTLRAALARLPRRQAQVIALRYLAALPEPDVATALGISLGSVKTHARRALAALRLDPALTEEALSHV